MKNELTQANLVSTRLILDAGRSGKLLIYKGSDILLKILAAGRVSRVLVGVRPLASSCEEFRIAVCVPKGTYG